MSGVQIWRVMLDRPPPQDWLSDEERARAGGFMRPEDGRRFAACRTALRGILAGRIGVHPALVSIVQPPGHRPETTPPIAFSVSHSGDRALIALAPAGIVGVDLEQRSPRPLGWLGAQMTPAERARGVGDPLLRWVCKEAALKATGHGLALDAAGVAVPDRVPDRGGRILLTQPKPRFWHLSTLAPWPGHVAALVTDRAHRAIWHDWAQ
ncbi:4'-phosphopantetheinyl transferase superfamily protein [Cereibacter sp. SYSU M97828]|nr:4'-phosphopantetheinyl transferase superfamily protein [Cereibacter flavus]